MTDQELDWSAGVSWDELKLAYEDAIKERNTALAEVERLQAEARRLREENQCLQDCLQLQFEETARAAAEVERLQKMVEELMR